MLEISKYETFKSELDRELSKTAESFVKIGYLLKLARDNPSILEGSKYSNINEMAAGEYGIDKTVVSRWININDQFSENGYSDRLKSEYQGYGYSKLAIMMNIPEEIREEITPNFSKSEIQAIKDELDEERKVSPMEIWLEPEAPSQTVYDDRLTKAVHQLLYENPEMYIELFEGRSEKEACNILAAAGEAIYTVRLQGIGRFMISVKENGVSLINMREPEDKVMYEWSEFLGAIRTFFDASTGPEESWEKIYNDKFPRNRINPQSERTLSVPKQEVAPVQQREPLGEKKKPQKVVKAKALPLKEIKEKETPLENQAEITDYEEALPEGYDLDNDLSHTIRGYKAAVSGNINRISATWNSDKPMEDKCRKMIEEAEDMIFRLKKILEVSDEH